MIISLRHSFFTVIQLYVILYLSIQEVLCKALRFLHKICLQVILFGGLHEDMYLKLPNNEPNPAERLKEALSSRTAFQRHFLEMAETAISTYKHVGRIRSARLIGRDLAAFYLSCEGRAVQAAAFLLDGLKTFQVEGWGRLVVQTLLELARCYTLLGDQHKYLRTCLQIGTRRSPINTPLGCFFINKINLFIKNY